MDWPLYWRLPTQGSASPSVLLDRFLDYISSKDLELYAAQEEAILEIFEGKNLILNTPTGSGKSLVALALHFDSMAHRRRSYYTCPIKALVNEKFRDLCAAFGPDQVGMRTGDGSVNPKAPIICCTAEILSNLSLREGPHADVHDIVMDEFHYYSDKQRGTAWQVPLLCLPQSRFLLMSATLGDMDFFAKSLTQLNQKSTAIVTSNDRPVPLDYEYRETPLHETVSEFVSRGLAPIYLVNFSQREAAEEAQNLLSIDFTTREEKQKIYKYLEGFKFQSPYGKDIQRILRHGVGLHHAGLLPKYRILVERMAQAGLLKVISGTDTLGVGVNVPIRSVLLTKLCKYDGEKATLLSIRDFQQISGRAGRRGFDTQGTVAAQAPSHVIENLKMKAMAAIDPKKAKKLVLRQPPPKGFVLWTKDSFHKLINSKPEPLISRFQVTHSLLLNVLGRNSDGFQAMKDLIRSSHESKESKKKLRKTAFALFRSLYDRKIIELIPIPGQLRPQVRVDVDLQDDFSLNHSLSLYLLDAIQVLDRNSPLYALDLLTLVESILESPDLILRKQLDRVKSEKMAEMKMEGMDYEDRMAELEKLEYPKPNRDFVYATFNAFAEAHPWVGGENIRPKSIAREMYENFHSYAEYIREYDLQRVEGLLLRYLSDVYKVLAQTIPPLARTEEVEAMTVYFGNMVRQVDSSLLEDWEKLSASGVAGHERSKDAPEQVEYDVTRDQKVFTRLLRNEIHAMIRALATRNFEQVLALIRPGKVDSEAQWTLAEIEKVLSPYFEEHQKLRTDPASRNPIHTHIRMGSSFWSIEQILLDEEDANDWSLNLQVDFAASQKEQKPILQLVSIQSLSS